MKKNNFQNESLFELTNNYKIEKKSGKSLNIENQLELKTFLKQEIEILRNEML